LTVYSTGRKIYVYRGAGRGGRGKWVGGWNQVGTFMGAFPRWVRGWWSPSMELTKNTTKGKMNQHFAQDGVILRAGVSNLTRVGG